MPGPSAHQNTAPTSTTYHYPQPPPPPRLHNPAQEESEDEEIDQLQSDSPPAPTRKRTRKAAGNRGQPAKRVKTTQAQQRQLGRKNMTILPFGNTET